MNFRSLFVDKDKLVMVNMELAIALDSLDEAIVLNQLNYWIERNKDANRNFYDGHYWVYNSYESWKKKDFPVWSATKIKRIFTSLEGKGIVLSANYNRLAIDKTKWYTIDFDKLKKFIEEYIKIQNEKTQDQNEMSEDQNGQPIDQNDQTLGQHEIPLPETNNRDYITENTNRDYSSEITPTPSPKEIERERERVDTHKCEEDTPVPKKQLPMGAPRKKTKSELKQLEREMIDRFFEIASEYDISDIIHKNTVKVFKYYLEKYTERTGKVHPILSDKTLEKIFTTLATIQDAEYGHFDNVAEIEPDGSGRSALDDLVDAHFKSEHSQETDWHISHFASSEYLEKLAQRVVEW